MDNAERESQRQYRFTLVALGPNCSVVDSLSGGWINHDDETDYGECGCSLHRDSVLATDVETAREMASHEARERGFDHVQGVVIDDGAAQ